MGEWAVLRGVRKVVVVVVLIALELQG